MQTARTVRPVRVLAALLLTSALALAGCSAADDGGGSSSDAKAAAPGAQKGAADSGSASGAKASGAPKLTASAIIRTASLTVQVKDVPKALDDARTTVETAGGFIGNESTSRDARGHERTRVVLRVPSEKYDQVLGDLEGTGKLIDRSRKAEDVTDQVVDVESRIKSQRASVARVRELMDKATKLSDVVSLEGELSSREADLEALLAQQASLKDRTSLATITLSLSETPVKKAAAKDEDPGFLDALAGGWHVFVTLLRWIALAFGAVLPFAAVAALVVFVWVRLVRPRLPRRPAPATTAAPGAVPGFPAPSPAPAQRPAEGREEH
ncbi:hypothetical protein AQJ43_30635 [Streptomyces avermitilis]|uniref:Lipoprotein n=2 Tax=Streptomyces avermitilis TaxID=33903 RepID=Q82KY8_STRAW|nr:MULTISPECIES: DUF4349 domain-containing protein [Streptomyces]KUN50831.1 hypothetical protein AQJ43_30635 [Streptomyces avermitilis]MYS97839.1 DUF4349 domain-containing protein [Streptomyces sp. SID5469]OOV24236.1 hypothetical protein SM007_31005 [Streptomyces avermitilis]BAC69935.1 putative lipoprotein [Streptomyces avermitilis MA-4680 = NBRC 14893]BBJ49996.1 hypothetical protein SAVMC3_26250 [Streptomyces avermitilis]